MSSSSSDGHRLRNGHSLRRRRILSQVHVLAAAMLLGPLFVMQEVDSFQPRSAHVHAHHIRRRLPQEQRMFGVRGRPLPAAMVVQENEPSYSRSSTSTDTDSPPDSSVPDAKPISTQSSSPVVHDFDTPLKFLEALSLSQNDHNSNRLMVVKYYASYCKICQRAGINYKKIAIEEQQRAHAQQNGVDQHHPPPIDFYQLDAGRLSGDTLKQLGVTKFPFCQIFFRGDCVASFGLSTGVAARLFGQRVRGTLDVCLARTEDEWEAFRTDFAPQLKDNLSARDAVQESLTATMTESSSSDEYVNVN
jgi:hypothetical protein